jgi:hypothetical protein
VSEKKPSISPIHIDVDLDATEAVNKLVDAGIDLGAKSVGKVLESLAGLTVDILDVLRGPFQRLRLRQITQLAIEAKALREAQGVTEPKALPPKIQQIILEEGSFVEDDKLRGLWAQLIVNAQAGMPINDYLFEVLGKLSGEEVQLLERMINSEDPLPPYSSGMSRLEALGLVVMERRVDVERLKSTDVGDLKGHALLVDVGYEVTSLGDELLVATNEPDLGPDQVHSIETSIQRVALRVYRADDAGFQDGRSHFWNATWQFPDGREHTAKHFVSSEQALEAAKAQIERQVRDAQLLARRPRKP